MLRTKPDSDPFKSLSTGVARLDGSLQMVDANPAFLEHTGFGISRLQGHTLAAMKPDGEALHALALRVKQEAGTYALCGGTVCAAPGREARLDFTLSPSAEGVLVEAHPARPVSAGVRTSESLRGFAHEIRNPLAAISGAAQLLQQSARDTRHHELAQLIRDEVARLATLADRLLGARSSMATRAVNVHALLERVAELLQVERSDIAIVRDYDPSLPAWHGDPNRLLQALLNLVRNAAEANARRVVLRSRAEAGWRDGRGQRVPALRLEVEDDGDGVPEALVSTLFDPMVSGRPDGTGLGLALAREIAREHGGDLTLQSHAHGTRFVLLLPRHHHSGGSG